MKIQLLCLILFLIPIAFALPDCNIEQDISNIPCIVTSSWRPSSCNDTAIIYNESNDQIGSAQWNDTIVSCQFVFNYTSPQTYHFNSSINSGAITVKVDNMQIGIMIGIGIIISFFMILAFKLDDTHFILKLLLIFESVGLVTLIPATFIIHSPTVIFQKAIMTSTVIFFLYVVVYFVWWLFEYFRKRVVA